jgi:hypothetical protein
MSYTPPLSTVKLAVERSRHGCKTGGNFRVPAELRHPGQPPQGRGDSVILTL